MRIKVNPDQLRALAQQFSSTGSDLQSLNARVGNTWGSLDWSARQAARVDGQIGQARSLANSLASKAQELSRYLAGKAHAFEEADRQGVGSVQAVSGVFSDWQRQWLQSPFSSRAAYPTNDVNRQLGLGGLLGDPNAATRPTPIPGHDEVDDLASGVLGPFHQIASHPAYSALKGLAAAGLLTYAIRDGKVIITGSRTARELAGLSSHLTRIGVEKLPAHIARQELPSLSKSFLRGAVVSAAFEWWEHRKEYETRRGADLSAAVTVDGVLGVAKGVVSASVGGWLGAGIVVGGAALLGVTAAPAAAVVIGGVVGAAAVGWMLDKGFKAIDEKFQVREKAISAVSTGYTHVARGVSNTYNSATRTVRNAARAVDNTLKKATSAVTTFFQPAFRARPIN